MKIFTHAVLLFLLCGCAAREINTELTYRHHAAEGDSGKAPVIVMLHGYGSNENNLFSLAGAMPRGYHVVSVRAPNAIGNAAYAWFHLDFLQNKQFGYKYESAAVSRKKLLSFLSTVSLKLDADTSRVILLGFSQGAMMAYDLALNAPEKFVGVAALSGGIMPESKERLKNQKSLKNISFFIGHGRADDVVGFSSSEEARDFLTDRGANVVFHPHKTGHGIPEEVISGIVEWLNKLSF